MTGVLKAVVFDWAGTLVDHGSRAPMGAFVEVFRRFGVAISIGEARGPMGRPKWDHIAALLAEPSIAARWTAAHGTQPSDADIARIYDVFVPLNAAVVTDYADLIPGVLETIATCRDRGLKIGSTTGYTREIMDRLRPAVAARGLRVDNLVCAGDLPSGRPGPLMMYRCFTDLDVWPAHHVVKVDDTTVGIAEGRSAGCWTVAVALSGNAAGLSQAELGVLSPSQREALRVSASRSLASANPDYTIDSVADLIPVLYDIERRLALGERPMPN
ncbi:MAG: phosphonoacetaldehyde hydrolase [Hyphomicrobiaceae bacterium]|nr:phosphonoacetaldehyde hydrolase [Hyphomicrobiaceae bacterium]